MAHHGADIKFAPALLCPSAEDPVVFTDRLIEDRAVVIVVVILGIGPGVKRFFDHEDSPLRTFFQEVMIGGIVRTAHGIDSHLLEKIKLPVNRPGKCRSSERSLIVMKADALQLHRFAIQEKALLGIKLRPPVSEPGINAVKNGIPFSEFAVQKILISFLQLP